MFSSTSFLGIYKKGGMGDSDHPSPCADDIQKYL